MESDAAPHRKLFRPLANLIAGTHTRQAGEDVR